MVEMSDKELERLIKTAVNSIPIPWEQLWAVFQKILQRTLNEKEGLSEENNKS